MACKEEKYLKLLEERNLEGLKILLTENMCKSDSIVQRLKWYVNSSNDGRLKGYTKIDDELYMCNGVSWWIHKIDDRLRLMLNTLTELENKYNNMFDVINKHGFNWDKSTKMIISVEKLETSVYKNTKLVKVYDSWYDYRLIMHFCKVQKNKSLVVCKGNRNVLSTGYYELYVYSHTNVNEIVGMIMPCRV